MWNDKRIFIMKLLILVTFSSFCVCSEDNIEIKERQIAGGGNYGGFIGLTTYGTGPFLVKGKYERDQITNIKYEDDGKQRDSDKAESNYDIDTVGYDVEASASERRENVQKDQRSLDVDDKNDDDIESLGYKGVGCIGQFEGKYKYGGRSNQRGANFSGYYDDETRELCDHLFGYTGPTANDEPENLIRPCALDDWQCIRKFFAANSDCKPAYGPIPDPLHININTLFYPVVNITFSLPNLKVRGLSSARIQDFYVNKASGNLVFAIDVTKFNETVPRVYVRYRRTAKESIVLADYGTVEFGSITLTAVIPKVPHLRLDLADIHADLQDTTTPYFLGPGAYNSTDPEVVTAFAEFTAMIPIILRESLLFQSQLYTSIYIQKNICDFGLKVVST